MTLTLIAGFCLIGIEIWVDTLLWKRKLNDKPFTTVGWIILVMVLSYVLPGAYHHNALLLIGQRFMFFDFALNIARWKKIPVKNKLVRVFKFEKSKYEVFLEKLFYHGEGKKKFSYDWIMGKIWWPVELLIKFISFITPILIIVYDVTSIFDAVWYWMLDLSFGLFGLSFLLIMFVILIYVKIRK